AFPPHVGPLSLQSILLEQYELHSGEAIPVGALRLPRLARWELRRPSALSMESIWIHGVHRDEILYHHLCPTEGEFAILLLIAGASVPAHGDSVSRVMIDEQGRNLVDLLLASVVEAFPARLKGDRFDPECADLPQAFPGVIAQGFEINGT